MAAPPDPAAATARVDIVVVELNRLLNGYHRVLSLSEGLPLFGRTPTCTEPGPPAPWFKPLSFRRSGRFVSRPLVRTYVETHMRAQLMRALRQLDLELFKLGFDAETLKYREVRTQLGDRVEHLLSWNWLRRSIAGLPVISIASAIVAAWFLRVGENRPSGFEAITAILLLLVLVLNLYVFLVLPSIRLGFRAKRALFSGGTTDPGIGFDPTMKSRLGSTVRWIDLEGDNLYQLEDAVFAILGWTKRREVPVDLLLSYQHFNYIMSIPMLVLIVLGLDGSSSAVYLIVTLVAVYFFASELRAHIRSYRRRAALALL